MAFKKIIHLRTLKDKSVGEVTSCFLSPNGISTCVPHMKVQHVGCSQNNFCSVARFRKTWLISVSVNITLRQILNIGDDFNIFA